MQPPALPLHLPSPSRVPALSDWQLLLTWAQHGRAEAHFGDAGVTNLLHTLRDALAKATGGAVLAGGPGGAADARRAGGRERQAAQAQARQDATLVLMKELAPLLRKLQTDPVQARGTMLLVVWVGRGVQSTGMAACSTPQPSGFPPPSASGPALPTAASCHAQPSPDLSTVPMPIPAPCRPRPTRACQ